MNLTISNGVVVDLQRRTVTINGKVIPFHEKMRGTSLSCINGKVYIDTFELKDGKWKRTLAGIWHFLF